MNFKKIFIACTAVGVAFFLMAGVLYIIGGRELFKSQDNYDNTVNNKTIEKEETIEGIQTIKVNTSVGNINFVYIDEDNLKLELINPIGQSDEPIKITKDKDTLKLDVNDVENKINFHIGKNFKDVRKSELNMLIPSKYKGNIDISSEAGNIKGEYAGRELRLETDVGNIDVEINEIESGKITTDIGNIKVRIQEEMKLTLDLKTDLGKIKNNLKYIKNVENSGDTDFGIMQDIKFDVNEGGSLLNINSDLGNIELYN